MIENCYYHAKHLPLLDKIYVDEAYNADYYHYDIDESLANSRKLKIPESLHSITSFTKSQFCQDLATHFNVSITDEVSFGPFKSIKASYIKILPYHGVDWHTDASRDCAINILLSDVDNRCVTLFRNKDTNKNVRVQENWSLDYELYRPVLLNTRIEHMVANYSSKDRYILTIGLPKHIKFDMAKNFLENYVPSEQL